MLNIKKDFCLKRYNTFGVSVNAKYFSKFKSVNELNEIIASEIYRSNKTFVLGEGSNILLTQDFDGLILRNMIKGIKILKDNPDHTIVCVGAGVNWHKFVKWSIDKELSGIENLALIPGTVGASPVQNIGAYGMEVKESISKVHYFDIKNQQNQVFTNKQCQFKYRTSIFKENFKDKTIITHVEFKLFKKALKKIDYGEIKNELDRLKLKPSPKNIAKVVIKIRKRKLPDPKEIGNSGSFFKNPIISNKNFKILKEKFPDLIGYKISKNKIKLAAGWLIENAGLKGFRKGDAGVHKRQALVLVNYKNASGKEIIDLAKKIQNTILENYGVKIEPEVHIL